MGPQKPTLMDYLSSDSEVETQLSKFRDMEASDTLVHSQEDMKEGSCNQEDDSPEYSEETYEQDSTESDKVGSRTTVVYSSKESIQPRLGREAYSSKGATRQNAARNNKIITPDRCRKDTRGNKIKLSDAQVYNNKVSTKHRSTQLPSCAEFNFTGSDMLIMQEIDQKQMELSEKVQQLQDKIKCREDCIKKLEKDKRKLINNYDSRIKALEEELKESEYAQKEMKKKIRNNKQDYKEALQEQQDKLDEAGMHYDTLKKTTNKLIAELNSRIDKLMKAVGEREKQCRTWEASHSQLETSYDSQAKLLLSQMGELEDINTLNYEQMEVLRDKLQDTQKEYTALEEKLIESREQLEKELHGKVEAEVKLQLSIETLQMLEKEKEEMNEKVASDTQEWQNQFDEKNQELTAAQEVQKKVEEELKESTNKLNDTTQKLIAELECNKESSEKIQSHEEEIEELKIRLEEEAIRTEYAESKYEELLLERELLENEFQQHVTFDPNVHIQRSEMDSSLSYAQEQLLRAQEQHRELEEELIRARNRRRSTAPDVRHLSTSHDQEERCQSTSPDARRQSTSPDTRRQSTSPDARRQSTSPNGRCLSTSPHARRLSTYAEVRHPSISPDARRRVSIAPEMGRRVSIAPEMGQRQSISPHARQLPYPHDIRHPPTGQDFSAHTEHTLALFSMFNQLLMTFINLNNAKAGTSSDNDKVANEIHALTQTMTMMATKSVQTQHSEMPTLKTHFDSLMQSMKTDFEQRLRCLEQKLCAAEKAKNRSEEHCQSQLIAHLKGQIEDTKQLIQQMSRKEETMHHERDKAHTQVVELQGKVRSLERIRDNAVQCQKDKQDTIDCLKQQLEKKNVDVSESNQAHIMNQHAIQELKQELEKERAFKQQLEIKLHTQVQAHSSERHELETRIDAINNNIDSLKRERDAIVDKYKQEISNLKREYEDKIYCLSNDKKDLQYDVKTAKKELKRLEKYKNKEIQLLETELDNAAANQKKIRQDTTFENRPV